METTSGTEGVARRTDLTTEQGRQNDMDRAERRQYSPRVGQALAYAAEQHAGQLRKGKDEPYLSHVLAVTALVTHHGGDEDQIITAALHDTVEDQGGHEQLAQIRELFGPEVASLVLECSDAVVPSGADKPPWRSRKERYLQRLQNEPPSKARLIEACDKVANLRDLVEDVRDEGRQTLERFGGGPAGVLWYYGQLSEILVKEFPLLHSEFQLLLDELLLLTCGQDSS